MDRVVRQDYASAIGAALGVLPERFVRLMAVPDFLCGTDPVFAGLHSYADTLDGRSYRDTAHCVYPGHQTTMSRSNRKTTIVLPQPVLPHVIVHELGHALDESLGFDLDAAPITEYARTNRGEAFAEALVGYLYYGYGVRLSPRDEAFFDALGR